MTLAEAKKEALKVLKQVMEEKLIATNVEVYLQTVYNINLYLSSRLVVCVQQT